MYAPEKIFLLSISFLPVVMINGVNACILRSTWVNMATNVAILTKMGIT